MIRKALIGVLLVGALALPATAQAHFGDRWFGTAAKTGRDIPDKYPKILSASCWSRGPLKAHFLLTNGTRKWDHFGCIVNLVNHWNVPSCVVLVHITGPRWSDFYLTGLLYSACSPRDIR